MFGSSVRSTIDSPPQCCTFVYLQRYPDSNIIETTGSDANPTYFPISDFIRAVVFSPTTYKVC